MISINYRSAEQRRAHGQFHDFRIIKIDKDASLFYYFELSNRNDFVKIQCVIIMHHIYFSNNSLIAKKSNQEKYKAWSPMAPTQIRP